MINKATLVGRIGKKDDKTMKNGNQMCCLSIATSRKYIDSQGQQQEQTTWHNVNFFNKIGEIATKYAVVGNLVYIEGEISNKKIDDGNGGFKFVYSIVGNEIKFLPSGKKEEAPKQEKEPSWMDAPEDDSIPF